MAHSGADSGEIWNYGAKVNIEWMVVQHCIVVDCLIDNNMCLYIFRQYFIGYYTERNQNYVDDSTVDDCVIITFTTVTAFK